MSEARDCISCSLDLLDQQSLILRHLIHRLSRELKLRQQLLLQIVRPLRTRKQQIHVLRETRPTLLVLLRRFHESIQHESRLNRRILLLLRCRGDHSTSAPTREDLQETELHDYVVSPDLNQPPTGILWSTPMGFGSGATDQESSVSNTTSHSPKATDSEEPRREFMVGAHHFRRSREQQEEQDLVIIFFITHCSRMARHIWSGFGLLQASTGRPNTIRPTGPNTTQILV